MDRNKFCIPTDDAVLTQAGVMIIVDKINTLIAELNRINRK